jgi:hypothetical protein
LNFEPPQGVERSRAVELLERLEPVSAIRDHTFREGLKKGIRKILTGTSVPLDPAC